MGKDKCYEALDWFFDDVDSDAGSSSDRDTDTPSDSGTQANPRGAPPDFSDEKAVVDSSCATGAADVIPVSPSGTRDERYHLMVPGMRTCYHFLRRVSAIILSS